MFDFDFFTKWSQVLFFYIPLKLDYLISMKLKDISSRLEAIEKEVIFLRKENAELKERLATYENPKNSCNSSMPPSEGEYRPKRNQNLCKPCEKKLGRQLGRKGKTLEIYFIFI